MINESMIIRLYVDEGLSGRGISKKTGYTLTTENFVKNHPIEFQKVIFSKFSKMIGSFCVFGNQRLKKM